MSDSEPNGSTTAVASAPVKRGRGRPRKDPSAPPKPKSSVNGGAKVPGKRGRKPGSTNKPKAAPAATGERKKRGRPPKNESDKKSSKKLKKAESSESDEGQDNSSLEESDE